MPGIIIIWGKTKDLVYKSVSKYFMHHIAITKSEGSLEERLIKFAASYLDKISEDSQFSKKNTTFYIIRG